MAKGESGRIVVDIDPALKRRLYSALALEDSTLKDWFIQCAERYIEAERQPNLSRNNKGSAK